MHTGITGQIRKTRIGRCVLLQINTGTFWIYGILTYWLAFSLSGLWWHDSTIRVLLSLLPALIAAFTLPQMIQAIFWRRFRNPWIDTFVITVFALAIFAVGYARDVQDRHEDALYLLLKNIAMFVVIGLISYASRRQKAA